MPTPSEQKALAFLSFVILLGGAVRVVRAGSPATPTAAEQQALARQAVAAESAGAKARRPKKSVSARKVSRLRRAGGTDTVAGIAGVPFSYVRPDRSDPSASGYVPRDGWVNGFPPPSARIDLDRRPGAVAQATGGSASRPAATSSGGAVLVDVDVATAAELDGLPRVGPALAARIIANRDSLGPFGSLEGLRRVRGMGPATLKLLAPRVTFSRRAASFPARSRY